MTSIPEVSLFAGNPQTRFEEDVFAREEHGRRVALHGNTKYCLFRPIVNACVKVCLFLFVSYCAYGDHKSYVLSQSTDSYTHWVLGGNNVEEFSNTYTVNVPSGYIATVNLAKVIGESRLANCDNGRLNIKVNDVDSNILGVPTDFYSTGTIALSAAAWNPSVANVYTPIIGHYSWGGPIYGSPVYTYYTTYYYEQTYTISVSYEQIKPELSSLSISGSTIIKHDGSATYRCTATFEDNSTETVVPTWSISSGNSYATIDSSGVLTANNTTTSQKTVVVKASFTRQGITRIATKSITIEGQPVLSDIIIDGPDSVEGDGITHLDAYKCTAVYSDGTQYANVAAELTIIAGGEYAAITDTGRFTAYTSLEDRYVTIQAKLTIAEVTVKSTKTVKIYATVIHDGGVYTPVKLGWSQPACLTLTTNSEDSVHVSTVKEWQPFSIKFCYRNFGSQTDKIKIILGIKDENGKMISYNFSTPSLEKGEYRIYTVMFDETEFWPTGTKEKHFHPGKYQAICHAESSTSPDKNQNNQEYIFDFEVVDDLIYLDAAIDGPDALDCKDKKEYVCSINWDNELLKHKLGGNITPGMQIQLRNSLSSNFSWSIVSNAEYASVAEGSSYNKCKLESHNMTRNDQTVIIQASFIWYSSETFSFDRVITLTKSVTIKANDSADSDTLPNMEDTATPAEVEVVIDSIGFADSAAIKYAVGGSADNYNALVEWARSLDASEAEVIASPWVARSYLLGADALVGKEIASEDVKVETFSPLPTYGKFEFIISVNDVKIGGGSVSDAVLKENLKKVLGIEGAKSLTPGSFSSSDIDIVFDAPVNGKAKFTVTPPADAGDSFFMRVRVK